METIFLIIFLPVTICLTILGAIIYVLYKSYINSYPKHLKNKPEQERLTELNKKILMSGFGFSDKGDTGENFVERVLLRLTITRFILRNAYIPYKNKTSEIDILMITHFGIFVFESKNYSGWIFGSAKQANWTQSLNNKTKNKFYNPIMQNQTHIKALSEYLNLPIEMFHSYIVFSERCELKKVPTNCNEFKILNRNLLNATLNNDFNSLNTVLTIEQMNEYYNKLLPLTLVTEEQKQEHIEKIKSHLT